VTDLETTLDRAAEAIAGADALLIAAGAGMGVDSGLPDFRGREGFWRAYPPLARLGLSLPEMANPRWFRDDPALAWGFYGHRLNLYRATRPHEGFQILRRWGDRKPHGAFVFTSNVDGQFQAAGFDPARILECHGTLHRLQCFAECGQPSFPAPPGEIEVDLETLRAPGPLPSCPACGALARPNILMFGDGGWDSTLADEQARRYEEWRRGVSGGKVAVVELGAGLAVATVRAFCEGTSRLLRATLIRVNPGDPAVPPGQLALPLGAREAVEQIDARIVI
jgi:NAD-dependent SIR2 family protein deacetylase